MRHSSEPNAEIPPAALPAESGRSAERTAAVVEALHDRDSPRPGHCNAGIIIELQNKPEKSVKDNDLGIRLRSID